jgi:hypothetical protein
VQRSLVAQVVGSEVVIVFSIKASALGLCFTRVLAFSAPDSLKEVLVGVRSCRCRGLRCSRGMDFRPLLADLDAGFEVVWTVNYPSPIQRRRLTRDFRVPIYRISCGQVFYGAAPRSPDLLCFLQFKCRFGLLFLSGFSLFFGAVHFSGVCDQK